MNRKPALWLFVVLALGVLAGGTFVDATSPGEAEQLARQLFEAWSEHDLDRIDTIFTADGVYEDVPPLRSYRGPDQIRAFLTAIWQWAPDIAFDISSVAVAGDTVVVEWVMTGTQTGPIGAIPASGEAFSLRGASVMEIHDGRITRNSDYYDLSSLLVQFGVRYAAPPPAGPGD